jgi:hypothetical protein
MLASAEIPDLPRLYSYLDQAYHRKSSERPGLPALHVFSLTSTPELDLESLIRQARSMGLQADVTPRSKDLYQVSLGVRQARQPGLMFKTDGFWIFLNDSPTAEVESTIRGFSNRLFPFLKQSYLPSNSLLDLLERLTDTFDEVIVTEGTIWMQGQTTRSWKKAPQPFARKEFQREASRDSGKWTGISVRLLRDGRPPIHCRLHERGHMTLYSGPFTDFRASVLLPYLGAVETLRKSLRGKERKDSPEGPKLSSVPLSLPKSLTPGLMDQLRDELVSHYTTAVLHTGNPLLLLQLVNRADGSAFDVFAYDRVVRIVPREKASADSITELVSVVSDVLPSAELVAGAT